MAVQQKLVGHVCREKPKMKINSFKNHKYRYLVYTRSDKAFKDIVVCRPIPLWIDGHFTVKSDI